MARTVADQMVEVLAAAGVKRIYGIVGDSLNGFTEALRNAAASNGCMCGMRRSRPSPPAPTPMSRADSPSAPAAAGRATFISSTASSTAIARACRSSPSPPRSRRPRSGAAISRKRIPNTFSANAATIANSSHVRANAARARDRGAPGDRANAACRSIVIPGDVALRPAETAPTPTRDGPTPAQPVVAPSDQELDRMADFLNARSG